MEVGLSKTANNEETLESAGEVPPSESKEGAISPPVDIDAMTAQLSGMFDMSPLTSVIGQLLAVLNTQRHSISTLTISLAAVEKKANVLSHHISVIEGDTAAAKDRISALEARDLQASSNSGLCEPEETQRLLDKTGAAEKKADEDMRRRLDDYKNSLPDYNSICDNRIKEYFGNSELLKNFTKKIDAAHMEADKVPALEQHVLGLQKRLDELVDLVDPQAKQTAEAWRKASEAVDMVTELHRKHESDEQLRQKAREAMRKNTQENREVELVSTEVPKRGVSVPIHSRTKGIVKVSSNVQDVADANDSVFAVFESTEGSEQLNVSDDEGVGTCDLPSQSQEGPDDVDDLDDAEEAAVATDPDMRAGGDKSVVYDVADVAAQIYQLMDESIEECFDKLVVAGGDPEAEPDQEPEPVPRQIPVRDPAAASKPKVVSAHTRDITKLDKSSSFQYTRPARVEERSVKPTTSLNSGNHSSASSTKSIQDDEQRQLSARRKQMLKDTLQTRMQAMDIPGLMNKGEKNKERAKEDPANSMASRLRVVEEILGKLPTTLSSTMDELRIEMSRHSTGAVALGHVIAGPNVRNELIQIMQAIDGVIKKVGNLENKLNGVIQASLDGQALDTNVQIEEKEEPIQVPIFQYIEKDPIPSIVSGPTADEVEAQIRNAVEEGTRYLITRKQCQDMVLSAFDKPREMYASSADMKALLEWKQAVSQTLDDLEGRKANKEETAVALSTLQTDTNLKLNHVKVDVLDTLTEIKSQETEALMRLHVKMESLSSYVNKIDIEVAEQLRPLVNAKTRKKGHVGDADGAAELENKMSKYEQRNRQIQAAQMDEIRKLVDSLQTVETELRCRPKERQIQTMVQMIEKEFKKQLGHDVSDLQSTMHSIANAVHSKAGKNDVVKLISNSIAHVQLNISRLNKGEIPAGGYKCLSCGHNGATVRLMSGAPHHDDESVNSFQSRGRISPDDASVDSAVSMLSDPSTAAVLNRTAGLRPLGGYSEPQDPKVVARAEKKKAIQAHISRQRPTTTSEPLYRRARLAAQLKEIPKVTPVDFGHLPQYAMDDDITIGSFRSMSSLQEHSGQESAQDNDKLSRSLSMEPLRLPPMSPPAVRASPSPGKNPISAETSIQ